MIVTVKIEKSMHRNVAIQATKNRIVPLGATGDGALRNFDAQCLHLIASFWISSAQKGHFVFPEDGVTREPILIGERRVEHSHSRILLRDALCSVRQQSRRDESLGNAERSQPRPLRGTPRDDQSQDVRPMQLLAR
ncbi:MAG: hypothetical protein Greene041619_623 [Candidatus Peregrinibacteria bacterium Greene0416_19]|nr:MAG: hypothetical protein Greene041619_623 [Candidatus Peregrinibacteria bacterium Greene0416_19]